MRPILALALGLSLGCGGGATIDFLAADSVLPGDPIAVTADGRVHVLVSVDHAMHVESGRPGGSWSLESIAASDDGVRYAALLAVGDSPHALWLYGSSSPYSVYYTARTPAGWSTPVDLVADLPSEMRSVGSAHLAASSTGELALVWSSQQLGFSVARIVGGRLAGEPELVTVADAPGQCSVLGRPAFDAGDHLVVVTQCTVPVDVPDTYAFEMFVVRDTGDGWEAEPIRASNGGRSALGPDGRMHVAGLPGWACTGDDECPEESDVMYIHDGEAEGTRIGHSATIERPAIAVDPAGTVYVAYAGRAGVDPVAPCEEESVGCLTTSSDGATFSEPRQLPGLPDLGLRATLPLAMTAYPDGAVLVECIGMDGCERLAVSTVNP